MKLSEYICAQNTVVRLGGKVLENLDGFKGRESILFYGSGITLYTGETSNYSEVDERGNFEVGENIAVQTEMGLLTISSAPGRRSGPVMDSMPADFRYPRSPTNLPQSSRYLRSGNQRGR